MSLPAVAPRVDSTRARILDVALDLFAAQGFAATTTRELSERLGFTKAALYYHFRTKDDLLQALVDPVVAELTVVLDRWPPAAGSMDTSGRDRLLADYLEVIVTHRRLLGVLVQDPSAGVRPAVAACRPFYDRLVELLAGGVHPTPEQRTRARFVLGGLHAAVLFARPEDDAETLRATALEAGQAVLGVPMRHGQRGVRGGV